MDADKFYLRYAHLKSAVKISGEVDAGDTICFSGDSGNASGVPNPHLHFEIAMKPTKNGSGLTNRYNPAFFVRLKPIVQKIQDDVKKERTKK
ncbi:M23 family metallopeptidase [Chryseobacterium sp. ERMR1:04]|uniref:M23 family metallopeptidase n=1 Tax=Chryseobacterium sp. ERMR1:04 TaxID=1705393 RepID=UPI0006C8C119|nr:M23 family metallopeptidase [Chryseobacterium sp. ERMR1:04]